MKIVAIIIGAVVAVQCAIMSLLLCLDIKKCNTKQDNINDDKEQIQFLEEYAKKQEVKRRKHEAKYKRNGTSNL